MTRFSPAGGSLMIVAVAAALLGTEGLLRRPLLNTMPASSIVLAEHLLLALFAVPVAIGQRRALARLAWRTWGVLLVIGMGASGGAALLFTHALASGSPTTASLLQNAQPLFVVLLAMVILKERLSAMYWPCLAFSIVGAYLLSFGGQSSMVALSRQDAVAAGFALGAAGLWASGTVLGRLVLSELSAVTLTAVRILIALPFLAIVALSDESAGVAFSGLATSPLRIGASALVPGLLAVLLFYRGLRGAKASHAVLAEFMYPVAALAGNWLVLGTMIAPLQGLGCLLLIATILILARQPRPRALGVRPRPAFQPKAGSAL